MSDLIEKFKKEMLTKEEAKILGIKYNINPFYLCNFTTNEQRERLINIITNKKRV